MFEAGRSRTPSSDGRGETFLGYFVVYFVTVPESLQNTACFAQYQWEILAEGLPPKDPVVLTACNWSSRQNVT